MSEAIGGGASPETRGWLPQLRGVLVLLHLVAVGVLASPDVGNALSREAWAQPTVQQEFEAWAQRLGGVGVDIDADELEARAWDVAHRWSRTREVISAPFRPYAKLVGARQSWRVFVAPHEFPGQLEVDVREHGAWRTIFVAGSREHDWRGRQLGHDRVRAAMFRYGWPQYRSHYAFFCQWLAARAAVDFPEADMLRCRIRRARTPTADEARRGIRPAGEYRDVIELPLEGER